MGRGDCWWDLVAERDRRDLADHVELPGRVSDAELAAVLSTADLGLSPDPLNPLNDLSTMNKTMEYMAFGLPVLAFDLVETRVSAGDAAAYADPRCADPIGAYADVRPFASDTRSGTTPSRAIPNHSPSRPQPVMTSSAISSAS